MFLYCRSYHPSTKYIPGFIRHLLSAFCFSLGAFSLLPSVSTAQIIENPYELQLENSTVHNEDNETEDDGYTQQLLQFISNPLDLNTACAEEIQELKLLTPIQIQNCISYRNLLGKFINIYELQAIPAWTIGLIEKIRPYIILTNNQERIPAAIKNRLSGGEYSALTRVSQIMEPSSAYSPAAAAGNYFKGAPFKLLMRYKYQFKNLLQYGVLAEKDAGEQFFKGKQKQGFDFYSAHFFVKNIGVIRALAIGDFTVNLGQGLTQWQSLAFKKNANVLNIKREGPVLRPYNSAGEINFHRGAGITVNQKKIALTVFFSYRKLDANFVADSSGLTDGFISSFQTSGYHRTKSETDDKGIQRQFTAGGNILFRNKGFALGLNLVQYKYALPILKDSAPYNIYALRGTAFGNYSVDYSYTYKNLHFFGEVATSNSFYKAIISGMLISVSTAADISLLYRNISPGYQSLYSNAFTETRYPTNERGIYTGLSVHPVNQLRVDVYADLYKFPWLRYQVDAPAAGTDYLLQLTYNPNKQLELLSRFQSESKAINFSTGQLTLSPAVMQPKKNWRTQFIYKINKTVTVKSRFELVWVNPNAVEKEQGFLTYLDFGYRSLLKPWSANLRFQYFESDAYNSRLYAYENDVLFSYSIPVFYGKGTKIYINYNLNLKKSFSIWIKIARSFNNDKTVIGSGLDEIKGNIKSEIKLQLLYKF